MNTQTADILKHLDHLRQIGVDHIALPSTEQEKLDREWEYFETVCDQVYFILENARYKMERQRMVLQDQLDKPIKAKNEATEADVATDPSIPTTLPPSEAGTESTQISSAPGASIEPPKAVPQDTPVSGDTQMLSPPANLTPTSITVQADSTSPTASVATSNLGTGDTAPTAPSLPLVSTVTASTIATTSAAISPASILQSAGELTPALLTVDGSMGMDTSLLTDLDKFQDSMLDLGDIGNLGDMDGMGGMGDMVDF
ncbi:hypothetical protein BGZ73_003332 [Actinomortierella ambigua]|nr:hypothetical protein BGZ73_003332 [Actinomortierella ambigua]